MNKVLRIGSTLLKFRFLSDEQGAGEIAVSVLHTSVSLGRNSG